MDDSLDKLIGRTEANYIVESNDQVLKRREASDENSNERNTKRLTFKKH